MCLFDNKNGPCRFDQKRNNCLGHMGTLGIHKDLQGPRSRGYCDELDSTYENRRISSKGDFGLSYCKYAGAEKNEAETIRIFGLGACIISF